MVEDIAYNTDLQTEYDDVGDIDTVDGEAAIEQAVVTALIERVETAALTPTPTRIEQRRSQIAEAVDSIQFTEPPINVSIESIEEGNGSATVTYRVETNRITFSIQQ